MKVEEIKEAINNLDKEDIMDIWEFCEDLLNALEEEDK